jgi:hypothetical protein
MSGFSFRLRRDSEPDLRMKRALYSEIYLWYQAPRSDRSIFNARLA